jgi:adenosylmethionine-8-amino-7-oxononanoate aminotransferase
MRCASWAGKAAGKIKTRAENVKAALNLSKHFIVRIVRGIGFVVAAETSPCRQARKPDQWDVGQQVYGRPAISCLWARVLAAVDQ